MKSSLVQYKQNISVRIKRCVVPFGRNSTLVWVFDVISHIGVQSFRSRVSTDSKKKNEKQTDNSLIQYTKIY